MEQAEHASLSKTANATPASGGSSWLAYVVISVILGLCRLAANHSSSDARYQERLNSATRRAVDTRALDDIIQQYKASRAQHTQVRPLDADAAHRSMPSSENEELLQQEIGPDMECSEVDRAVEATRILQGRSTNPLEHVHAERVLQKLREADLKHSAEVPNEK